MHAANVYNGNKSVECTIYYTEELTFETITAILTYFMTSSELALLEHTCVHILQQTWHVCRSDNRDQTHGNLMFNIGRLCVNMRDRVRVSVNIIAENNMAPLV